MDILGEQFGVKRLAVVGGGHICGGFLEAGLVDEVSIMVAPGIDGRQGQTAVFDGITDRGCNPYRLKLKSVERWDTDIVWLRYTMESMPAIPCRCYGDGRCRQQQDFTIWAIKLRLIW